MMDLMLIIFASLKKMGSRRGMMKEIRLEHRMILMQIL